MGLTKCSILLGQWLENRNSWSWFLELLKADLGLVVGGTCLTIISDKQKRQRPSRNCSYLLNIGLVQGIYMPS